MTPAEIRRRVRMNAELLHELLPEGFDVWYEETLADENPASTVTATSTIFMQRTTHPDALADVPGVEEFLDHEPNRFIAGLAQYLEDVVEDLRSI